MHSLIFWEVMYLHILQKKAGLRENASFVEHYKNDACAILI